MEIDRILGPNSKNLTGGDQMKSLFTLAVILTCCLIFLTQCSSEGKWVKPGSGESESEKDYLECRSLALQECANTVWPGYLVAKNCVNKLINDCMNDRGWEYRKP